MEEECVCAIHICIHNGRLHMPILKMQICEEVCMCLLDHLNQTHLSFLFFHSGRGGVVKLFLEDKSFRIINSS